jgi:hypothetical protein
MALLISKIPDITYYLGESGVERGYALQPGASDYVTGGYPITASAVELGKLVGASILCTSGTGATYNAEFLGTAPLTTPQTQLNLVISSGSTQVAASTDLSGASWAALFLGW